MTDHEAIALLAVVEFIIGVLVGCMLRQFKIDRLTPKRTKNGRFCK